MRPSTELDEYYIYHAINPFFHSTEATGKWFVFVSRDEVDALWDKVVLHLQNGNLGPAAKVSTARDNPLQQYEQLKDPKTHVIIAYTRDYENAEERLRIAKALREIRDLSNRMLYYKRDLETSMGVYGEDCWYSILHPGTDEEVLNERLAR